jgi:TPR repeat protein
MPEGNLKVPSQIFRWFEKMKGNYEKSIDNVLSRFEHYSDSQQKRIDNEHSVHVSNLKESNNQLAAQQEKQIEQLTRDNDYFKKQISEQQLTITQLNSRYDVIVGQFLSGKRQESNIQNIFSESDFVSSDRLPSNVNDDMESSAKSNSNVLNIHSHNELQHNINEEINKGDNEMEQNKTNENELLFIKAIEKRQSENQEQAFQLFEQAAMNGHAKSMGAMGRSYFLAEGVKENHTIGLAWLIQAAKQELAQAVTRVEHFQECEPELYQEALEMSETLFSDKLKVSN